MGVPKQIEPLLGDDSRPANEQYHAKRRAVNTPVVDEVITDTRTMYFASDNKQVFVSDLYNVGSLREENGRKKESVPFVHDMELAGPKGENVRFRAVFDDGAMVNAIDEKMFELSKNRLTALEPSQMFLRMADGRLVPSRGIWRGKVTIKGVSVEGGFEVFGSNKAWAVLVGKPLLEKMKAIHDYGSDKVTIPRDGTTHIILENQFSKTLGPAGSLLANLTIDIKQRTNFLGDLRSPSREVLPVIHESTDEYITDQSIPSDISANNQTSVEREDNTKDCNTWILDKAAGPSSDHPGFEQPDVSKSFEPTLLTRKTKPHNPARIATILNEVTIGNDLSAEETLTVQDLIAEYADCFALSMSEVLPVLGAEHRLDIPRDKVFRTKVNQRPQSPPQREFFNGVIDKMLAADIITPIAHQDVKCCGATTLAKKAHEGEGLTIDSLKHRVNDQCIAAGLPAPFEELPPREETAADHSAPEAQTKWRVCQDFAELNKVTQVPPMPQGDIRPKQQALSGHRWVTVFDFANGFYACEIRPEDRPYICFYVEGRGYFSYKRMPFGLTGAPSTFSEMTARALGDLVGTLIELFVDDGGMAGDTFDAFLSNTRRLLQRVRETGLSLSASKSSFFMTEATFAGARVGPDGIKPDLTKLTAIVDWKTPADLQNLCSFIGLAGYFRSLVKGYATMAQPLTDLVRNLDIPRLKGKAAYNRAMKGHSLAGLWSKEHDKAFLRLKVALTSEPVLKGPKFDGTPFIVTTDGCKYGFAGMLTQRFSTILPNGSEKTTTHPIAFISKRTSVTEEKYKPFLLEFAALKHTLDKFGDTIWGYPIELETDCQALRDHLLSSTLNSTHARWRDAVLAYNIVDVRHRPGKLNLVADGLSRKFVNAPYEDGDGHEWTVSEDWEARMGMTNDIFQVDTLHAESIYAALRTRFVKENVFREIIDSLLELDHGKSLRTRKRAKHKAKGYMIEEGRLWKVGDESVRAKSRLECITQEETKTLAYEIHRNNGHFHRDNIKAKLMDTITSPRLDKSITEAIMNCGKCKSFGSTHLHSLLEPITRRHPFELMVADTLSMPKGKGGFKKLSLWMDVYSQRLWVTKLKSAATGKTSKKSYGDICDMFTPSETLMVDGGPEFDNKELREECERRGTKLQICPAYSPWVNGLLEGTNRILLDRLKRMCAPDLGEDEYSEMDLPENWPEHLDAAIRYINSRILPNLKYSPNELILGLVVNTRPTPPSETMAEPTPDEVANQMAYVNQHRFDGYSQIVDHSLRRKAAFDKRVLANPPREVMFQAGDLVQVYRSDLDYTFKSDRKLVPKFSAPQRVVSRTQHSSKLQTLEGLPIGGNFSSRRLRLFIPRAGTDLEKVQRAIEQEWRLREEVADRVVDMEEIRVDGTEVNPDSEISRVDVGDGDLRNNVVDNEEEWHDAIEGDDDGEIPIGEDS